MKHKFIKLKAATLEKGSFRALLLVGTIMLGVLYIWQVNMAATTGYTMRDLESSIYTLEIEQERLDLQVAQLQSVDSVTERVQMLGLTEVKTIQYLTPGGGSVAINR
jgi:cell division protein FtsL